jgi:hypothetical protein
MFRCSSSSPASIVLVVRSAILASSICIAGAALAASDPPTQRPATAPGKSAPSATAKAKPERPPISYNSGVSPHEFPSDPRKVTVEVRPDGTRLFRLNGQGTEALIAHLGPDGKITYTCTDRSEQVAPVIVGDNVHER